MKEGSGRPFAGVQVPIANRHVKPQTCSATKFLLLQRCSREVTQMRRDHQLHRELPTKEPIPLAWYLLRDLQVGVRLLANQGVQP